MPGIAAVRSSSVAERTPHHLRIGTDQPHQGQCGRIELAASLFPFAQCRYGDPDRCGKLALRHAKLGALVVPPQKLYPPAMSTIPAVRVNRAPVLTLWATVVAERLGYPTETALTLGRFVAGSSARAKARSLGIADETQEAAERREKRAALKPQRHTVRLLGRDVPVLPADDGTLRADDNGKPASVRGAQSYIARAFGDRLRDVRAAMDALAASLPPEELNRVGFRLYEQFRPEVPTGAEGWGAKGELLIERIQSARAR